MARYIPLQEKLASLEEQGKRLLRRQNYLKGECDFLADMLITHPVKDMDAQHRLLREWEDEIARLEADLAYLRMEWARINRKGGVRPPRI